MPDRCQFRVFSGRRDDMRGHLCGRPVKSNGMCAVHTPEAITKRQEATTAKWKAEVELSRKRRERESLAYDALDNKLPQALARIAELEKLLQGGEDGNTESV